MIGPNPALPGVVLVRADPPGVVFHVVTVAADPAIVTVPAANTLRIDPLQSLEQAAPRDFAWVGEEARRAASQSNLRQLSVGIIRYVNDHNSTMPDAGSWMEEILPYLSGSAVFCDPSAPAGEQWSYAYNSALSHVYEGKIDFPAQTVMLFESSKGTKNASDTGRSVPVTGRHLGGTDYVTADGHVQWFKDGTKLSYRLDGK